MHILSLLQPLVVSTSATMRPYNAAEGGRERVVSHPAPISPQNHRNGWRVRLGKEMDQQQYIIAGNEEVACEPLGRMCDLPSAILENDLGFV